MDNKNNIEERLEEAWHSPYVTVPEKVVNQSWAKFRGQIKRPSQRRVKRSLWSISVSAAAFMLFFTTYFYWEFHIPMITEKNVSNVEKEIILPDGSRVILQQGAQLKYKKYFNKRRQVQLVGTAFFEVVKDSLREFTVGTGSSVIRVLGTNFSVNGDKNDEMEVALYTGRVSISVKGTAESYGLVPGEKFLFKAGKAHIRKFDPNLSFEVGNKFIDVDRMKIDELLAFLGDRFGYRFIPSTSFSNKWVTLRINRDDSLEELLDLLATINNITYEINEEDRIIVLTEEL